MQRSVYFVGSESEVAHHAAPVMRCDTFSVQIVAPTEIVDLAQPGDIAIFFSEHFDRFRQSIMELKAKHVGTIYLIDGILEWRNAWENRVDEPACPLAMRPVLCDKAAVIGASQARTLSNWGNGSKIEVVGIPRLDPLRQRWLDGAMPRSSNDSPRPFRVLVLSAKTPGFTNTQIETSRRSLLALKTFFDLNQKINGREIEVHWRLTAGLDKAIGVKNQISDLTGSELVSAMEGCDAVISMPSTAMLESMLLRHPVALLDFHNCPTYVPAAWEIRDSESIGSVVSQLLNPCPRRMQFQNEVLSDALQIGEPATDRILELLRKMFDIMDQQMDSPTPFQFPSQLLGSTVSPKNQFVPHELYPELEALDPRLEDFEVRAQLAHARREINHLQRIQQGLQDELAEAHSIFEQIQQHPIAGPIVRIRERIIALMKSKSEEIQKV